MKGVFVTGTDTGVGKTLVSAWLVRSWRAEYWKPVQTGTRQDNDSDTIRALVKDAVIHPSAYSLLAPLSPHEAARREGVSITLDSIRPPETSGKLVIEGAGGALVPLNDRDMMTELMVQLDLPVLVVARSGLGTINHTLLTLEALERRGVNVAGVIMNGPPNPENREAIENFSGVAVVAELPALASAAAIVSHPPLNWQA